MRASALVLLLTQDERLVQAARLEIYSRSPWDLVVARSFEEGQSLLADANPCAVLVHVDAGMTDGQFADLLWAASQLPRSAPVVALSDRYDPARARTMFQLGVADVLDRGEHTGKIAAILRAIVPATHPGVRAGAATGLRGGLPANPRLPHGEPHPARPSLPGLQRFSILGEG